MTGDSDKSVKVIRATYEAKQKVGGGGFDDKMIFAAEKRMKDAAEIFPSAAKHDMDKLDVILGEIRKGNVSDDLVLRIKTSAHEIKVNGQMFQYPLVSAVAESLVMFCQTIKLFSPLAIEVVALHLKTLKIALDQGPRAIIERDRVEILSGLEKACAKALES